MIIQNKIAIVYDIEIFPNVCTVTLKNTETKEVTIIEISERKNNIELLYDIFSNQQFIFVGYNNIHYDNVIVNFLFDYKNAILSKGYRTICHNLHSLSKIIIESDDISKWKQWKYANNFVYLDLLTMLFSSKLRVGLKEMQVTMQYHNVQEYGGDFNNLLPRSQIDEMLKYNLNDVESTEELLYKCEKAVKLREEIQKEYNIDVLSMDGVSIGKEILKTKYLIDTKKEWYEIKDLRSPCDYAKLSDIILEKINFESSVLSNMLNKIKNLVIKTSLDENNKKDKKWNEKFLFHNQIISFGIGGLHSINKPEIITCKEDEIILDVDAASLYPTLLIKYDFYPKHLGKEFKETYTNIYKERLEAKHNGIKVKNETLKLALNAVTGLMRSEYSWMYSPKDVLKININGQLFLLKLAEMLYKDLDCYIFNWNTDGLFVKFKKVDLEKFNSIVKEFENYSLLTMESDEFTKMCQLSVNDYLAVCKGYEIDKNPKLLKKKGTFIDDVSLGKGMQPMIIPKAINAYFADKIPIEETVYSSRNLNDFITYQKVDKKFSVEYKDELISHINRYYMSNSKNSGYLYKCIVDENNKRTNYSNMLKDSGVVIVNNFDEIKEFPKDINYNYYLSEIKNIIDSLEVKQLSLF